MLPAQQRASPRSPRSYRRREPEHSALCGILAHGFARVHCDACGHDRLVAFSCKGRGFCPSCGGKRMTRFAEHLIDEVLPIAPVRQWVLTVPYRVRYRMAYGHRIASSEGPAQIGYDGERAIETVLLMLTRALLVLEQLSDACGNSLIGHFSEEVSRCVSVGKLLLPSRSPYRHSGRKVRRQHRAAQKERP